MDRTQAFVIVFVFVCVFLAMGLAVYFSQGRESGALTRSDAPRFAAKPGTTREQAVALVSSQRAGGADTYGGEDAGADAADQLAVQSLSKDQESFARDTARAIVETARADGTTPAEAALLLAEAAHDAADPNVKVLLQLALGGVYAEDPVQPPEAVLAAFEEAARVAGNTAMRLLVARHQVEYLRRLGRLDEAISAAADVLETTGSESSGRAATAGELQLRNLHGDLLRDLGRMDEAADAYRAAVNRGLESPLDEDPAWADALRLAGLRLARLYRAMDRHEDAEEVGRLVRSRLARAGASAP